MTTNRTTIWIVVTERGDRPYVSTTKPTPEFLKAFVEPSEVFGRMYVVEAIVPLLDFDEAFAGAVHRLRISPSEVRVVCDETNNTPENLSRGELAATVILPLERVEE